MGTTFVYRCILQHLSHFSSDQCILWAHLRLRSEHKLTCDQGGRNLYSFPSDSAAHRFSASISFCSLFLVATGWKLADRSKSLMFDSLDHAIDCYRRNRTGSSIPNTYAQNLCVAKSEPNIYENVDGMSPMSVGCSALIFSMSLAVTSCYVVCQVLHAVTVDHNHRCIPTC
jgi:hypothetical protein